MPFTVNKENGLLNIMDYGGYESRNDSMIWLLMEANKIYNFPNFKTQMIIFSNDCETNPHVYNITNETETVNTVPDFNFKACPEVGIDDYEDTINRMHIAGCKDALIQKVGWIGNPNTNQMRHKLLELGENNKDMYDFYGMDWVNVGKQCLETKSKYLSLPELVKKYAILIDIEGNGYSGRLKYLLWSHRPVLLVERPHKEFFSDKLIPFVHYIPVDRDLSNLYERTKWIMDNPEKATEITNNAFEFCKKYLTREASYKRWNEVILRHIAKYD